MTHEPSGIPRTSRPTDTIWPVPKHYSFIFDKKWKFLNVIGYRGSEKTYTALKYIYKEYLLNPKIKSAQVYYTAPGLDAGKTIVRQLIELFEHVLIKKGFTKKHGYSYNKQTGEVMTSFGSDSIRRLTLQSYRQGDCLRGRRGDLIVLDEPAQITHDQMTGIIQHLMRKKTGKMLLIGTSTAATTKTYEALLDRGLPSVLHDRLQRFLDDPYDTRNLGDVWQTKVVTIADVESPKEVESKRNSMNDGIEFRREFMCDYKITCGEGFRFAMELERIKSQINDYVTYDEQYPVFAAWDIGRTCWTVCWIFQCIERQIRFIDYHEGRNMHINAHLHMIGMKEHGGNYQIKTMFLPHDAMAHTIASAASVDELCRRAGYATRVLEPTRNKSVDIQSAIEAVYRCHFHATKCEKGLERLTRYELQQSRHDEEIIKYEPTKRCEASYDAADAFRYVIRAVNEYNPEGTNKKPRVINALRGAEWLQ